MPDIQTHPTIISIYFAHCTPIFFPIVIGEHFKYGEIIGIQLTYIIPMIISMIIPMIIPFGEILTIVASLFLRLKIRQLQRGSRLAVSHGGFLPLCRAQVVPVLSDRMGKSKGEHVG
jgi:hypothetical protein